MKVFWSWQSDLDANTHRHFVREALEIAIEEVAAALNLEESERPALDQDTKGVAGAVPIPETILRKIESAAVCVADITPVARTPKGKAVANPNVMLELGWALHALGHSRLVLVFNTAKADLDKDLPFDLRNHRVMNYKLALGVDRSTRQAARQRLAAALHKAITATLEAVAEEQAQETRIDGVAADPQDRSIWAGGTGEITYYDTEERDITIHIKDPPRAYLRIVPAGWMNRVPPVNVRERLVFKENEGVKPSNRGGYPGGSWGTSEDGLLSYWFNARDDGARDVANLVMWFDETGEVWVLHGTAVLPSGDGSRSGLSGMVLLREWRRNLTEAMRLFDRFSASSVRRVEAGLSGVASVYWDDPRLLETFRCRKPEVYVERQARNWDDDTQRGFLLEAYNKVRDAFSLPSASDSELLALLGEQAPANES